MTTNSSPDSEDLITRVVDAFERMPVPPGPSVAETIELLERAAGGRPVARFAWKRIASHGREIARRPLSRLMLAASVCLAVVAGRLLVPGQLSTAQAFNMFADALVGAESAKFQLEVGVEGQPKQKLQSYYLAPGKMRSEMTGVVSIADMRSGKTVNLLPEQKTALVMNIKNLPNDSAKLQSNDFFEALRELLSDTRGTDEGGVKRLGEQQIDGHRAVGFRCDSPLATVTLWGDPATGLPVLVESVWVGVPRIEIKMSHFELNDKLDPALFDTTPPADYKVQSFDIDASKPTESALVEGLRMAANLNEGLFADRLDTATDYALVVKQPKQVVSDDKNKPAQARHDMAAELMTIGRGMTFAQELPVSADAHYAGRGVKLGAPDRPIFWYKSEGAQTYRVIYADLSIKEADSAPEVAGAVRLEKPRKPEAGNGS
ncbi:MAG TPA: hypothetical protein VHY91_19290 [Pirellulales bacterium]|jgi:outer membrane lipoprotein-sorting protein|nr:hypothetical protein [Pirellulales bacterium]